MTTTMLRLGFALVFALAGCGANGSNGTGTANPLVGTWKSVAATTVTVTLTDATFSVTSTGSDAPTGCMYTAQYGGSYTHTATNITATATAGSTTSTGCTDGAKNGTRMWGAMELAAVSNMYTYTIVGTTLTTVNTKDNAMTVFTRQ